MPSLAGTGGRSSHVSFTTSYWFGRMFSFLQQAPNAKRGAAVLAITYQSDTGASGGSLKRAARGLNLY
jgi:hypothetical protein